MEEAMKGEEDDDEVFNSLLTIQGSDKGER